MLKLLIKSIKDIFDKKILFTSLIPIIISAIFWGLVFFMFHANVNNLFVWLFSHIPFVSDGGWVRDLIETIGGIFLYYQLLIITSVMIVGLVADRVVDIINEKYYHLEKKGFGKTGESIVISLKQNLIFIILFIILLPTMFIPLVNIFVNIALWMILIKKPTFYDSISIIATKEEYNKLYTNNKFQIRLITFLGASLFLIPILGIFVYIIQLLMFAHFNMKRLQDMRGTR